MNLSQSGAMSKVDRPSLLRAMSPKKQSKREPSLDGESSQPLNLLAKSSSKRFGGLRRQRSVDEDKDPASDAKFVENWKITKSEEVSWLPEADSLSLWAGGCCFSLTTGQAPCVHDPRLTSARLLLPFTLCSTRG